MESSSGSDVAKPELIHKLEGSTDEIHGAVVITGNYKYLRGNISKATRFA
jgi:hypothetical protein